MTIIWGERVYLRPFEDDLTDEEIARVYHWSSDEQVLRWSGGAPTDLTLEEFSSRLRGERGYRPVNRRAFLIVTRECKLIGRVGCFAIDWQKQTAEMGIVIGESSAWGKGRGRDAINTLLGHIFATTTLKHINLFTFPENLRAQRCFAACGFRVVGSARRFSPDIGEFDGIEMEITRHEFRARQSYPIPISQDAP